MSSNWETENDGLYISIVGFFLIFVFFAKYSVTPKYFFSKKCSFDMGPLTSDEAKFLFNKFSATLKQLFIYSFDDFVILSKTLL